MKKIFFFLMAVILCSATAMADRTISGTVVSELDDEPLIGATVLPLPIGSAEGTATDKDGNFTLTVPNTCHEIQVSFIGLTTRSVRVSSEKMLIKLAAGENRLDEVVHVAYGTAKRSEYTGSASVVKADAISDALVSSVTSVLSGKVAGVQTLSSDGNPGSSPTLRIRGVGSINAQSNPLYVVDGVPFDGAISDIAPGDVESMTILKDAASTALYGARGANGVVLITTKRGAAGAAQITFDANWGSNSRAISNYNVISSTNQYMELLYEGFYNRNIDNGYSADAAWRAAANSALTATGYQIYTVPTGEYLFGRNGKINPNATLGYSDGTYYYTPDDWTEGSMTNGLRQNYNLSISGGTDRFKYYLSASYLSDDGIIIGSDFNRFSTRATVDYQAKTWLKVGTNLSYTYTDKDNSGLNNLSYSTSSGNVFFLANTIAPVYPMYVRNADGSIMTDANYSNNKVYDYGDGSSTNFTRQYMSMSNPIGDLMYNTDQSLSDVFDGKWYATITPIEGLNITGTAGYWLSVDRYHGIGNPFYGQPAASGGSAEQDFYRYRSINLQALASYNKTVADRHTFDVMVGYETYNYEYEYVYAYGYNMYSPTDWTVKNVIDDITGSGARPVQYTTRGILARAKYNLDNRYFFQASYRRDSSSRFAPDKRWGNFFSVSAAWDIAKESFLTDVQAVDQLKFKISFGQNGNDNLGSSTYYYYAWQDQYARTGSDGVWSDATLAYKGNENLTWETSNNFNVGFDFSFFQGKLDGTLEYYQRQVSDMLFFLPTASSLGYSEIPSNVGSMRNSGVELELNYNVFNTKNLSWTINANITTGSNKIVKLPEELADEGQWISGSYIYKEGESRYNMYLVSYAGVDSETGKAMYWGRYTDNEAVLEAAGIDPSLAGTEVKTDNFNYAYSGNSSTLVENRKATGNIMPKAYGGFGTTLNAYGVDFSISFAYQFGGRIYDSTYQSLMHGLSSSSYYGENFHVDILNRWQNPGDVTDVPRIDSADSYTASTSDRWLISSDYLSLNNITLGYTLPSKATRKLGIESIRFYGAAENVALWSKRKGLDPRQSYTTSNNSTYSPIRSISGGIRVQF